MAHTLRAIGGGGRLVFDVVRGITGAVETMHQTIAARPGPFSSWRPGEKCEPSRSPAAYSIIRGAAARLGTGLDRVLQELSEGIEPGTAADDGGSRIASALNGICGDYLEESGNGLSIAMGFWTPQVPVPLSAAGLRSALPRATGRVVLFAHGLGLSESCWRRPGRSGVGEQLRDRLGYTPIYLRYNTGRRISANGRELAEQLSRLFRDWPVPLESITLIGHSMGGLVLRSACAHARAADEPWLRVLRRALYLGTPHFGAPLERAGHLLTRVMQSSPYVDPLAFGAQRSAGIKDLRFGDIHDESPAPDEDMGRALGGSRQALPLLENVEHFFAAASVGRGALDPRGHALGDLLVRVPSAIGIHRDASCSLGAKPENCRVFYGMHHFDLLHHPHVHAQVVRWLAPPAAAERPATP